MGDEETFKLRRQGALSENDLALLGGDYKVEKGRNRLIGDFKKDGDIGSKAKIDSIFSKRKGRFTVRELSYKEFFDMKK